MLKKILQTTAVGALALAFRVDAAPMPHTYQLQASGFAAGGVSSGLIFPYEPLDMTLSVTFDPLFSSGTTLVDSFVSPLGPAFGPFVFRYDVTTIPKRMTIGDNCQGSPICSFTLSFEDLIMSLDFSDPNNPIFESMVIRTVVMSTSADFRPTTRTICEVGVTCAATPVPEPAGLALLGIGLAGLGFARRKRG